MKLLTSARAPNPRRVAIFLAEKGIELETEIIDIMQGAHREEAYRNLNPAGTVPALLLEDGTTIAESVAICRYIEALHPQPNLFGSSPVEQAQVDMWNRRAELMLLLPIANTIRHGIPAMAVLESPQCVEWAEISKDKAMNALSWFDQQMEGKDYIAGDNYSIADITMLVGVDFMKVARIRLDETLPNLLRWRNALNERPAIANNPA